MLTAFKVALILTVVCEDTGLVTTENVELCVPADTVTLGGIDDTAGVPLITVSGTTVSLFTGAANCTVPVLVDPPTTVEGLKVTDAGTSGVTVNFVVALPPFAAAESCTGVFELTFKVEITKEVDVVPAATVTVLGMDFTAPAPLSTVMETLVATTGATFNDTVPVTEFPPTTAEGATAILGTGGVSVVLADTV